MEHHENRILILEEEISKLPVGYISKKTINGKIRQYHQWTEEGKKKSRYVSDEAAGILAEQIEKRRKLQQELKTVKALLCAKPQTKKTSPAEYNTEVLLGNTLKAFGERASGLNARPLLQEILEFLKQRTDSRVLILYGLRRTGKTTLIQQAIAGLSGSSLNETAFLQVHPGDTMAALNHDLKILQNKGYKYIFIDEATLLEDFIEGAALFSDIYAACGMRIVLSGTDSLGFIFSADEQLYDRCRMLHTTFIPYREFESVLGINGIDEYIRYGGTMSLSGIHYNENSTFSSKKNTDEYVDSAIARNIQHSLKYYQDEGHFRHLQGLYDNGELTSAINRVVEDINHRFTIDVLTRDFLSHDLGISKRNLRRDREDPTDILDEIDTETFTKRLREALDIKNKDEQKVEITDSHRVEIREYLDLLDLTADISVQSLPVTGEKEYMTVISQPGLRYSQAEELIRKLLLDPVFKNISAVERKKITGRILDEIKGRMMEEIVLLETKKAHPECDVFKLKFAVGEFDMVVCDPENVTCRIYEIKHSSKAATDQYRHLLDLQKCKDTEFRFGNITGKYVIYRGDRFTDGEIEYINVEEYLKSL